MTILPAATSHHTRVCNLSFFTVPRCLRTCGVLLVFGFFLLSSVHCMAQSNTLSGSKWQRQLQIEQSVKYDSDLRQDVISVNNLLQSSIYPREQKDSILEIIHLGIYMNEYWNYKTTDVKMILETLLDFNAPSIDITLPTQNLQTIREDYAPIYDDFTQKREVISYKINRLFNTLEAESEVELGDVNIDGVPMVSQAYNISPVVE